MTGNSTFDFDGEGTINGGTVIVNGEEVTTLPNQMMGGHGGMMEPKDGMKGPNSGMMEPRDGMRGPSGGMGEPADRMRNENGDMKGPK